MQHKLVALAMFVMSVLIAPMPSHALEVALETHDGIYTVPAQINGSIVLNFFVDTGASAVAIPETVLRYLVQNGTVTQADVIGTASAVLADRSLYRAVGIRLRVLRVGDQVVRDVEATVVPGLAYPLLGQSFLGKFASVTFDNTRRVMILSGPAAVPQAALPAYPAYSAYPGSGSSAPPGAAGYRAPAYGWGSPYSYGYQPPGYGAYQTR